MWFVALLLQHAYGSLDQPVAQWNAFLKRASVVKAACVRAKPRKPPDPYPCHIYGAWLRWFHGRNVWKMDDSVSPPPPPVPENFSADCQFTVPEFLVGCGPPLSAPAAFLELGLRGHVAFEEDQGHGLMEIHPQAFIAGVSDMLPIIFDTGASLCVTHALSDFVTLLQRSDIPTQLGGLAHGLAIEGKGSVEWAFLMMER